MQLSDVTSFFSSVGNWVSSGVAIAVNYLTSLGIELSTTTAKIITLLFTLVLLYLFIKVIDVVKKPLKITIFALLIFLIISIGISLFV